MRADTPLAKLRQIEEGEIDADWGTLRHIASGLEVGLADLFRLSDLDPRGDRRAD